MPKKKKAGKPAAKGKAQSKKLSVKKRPAKDLDARKAERLKGGVTGNISPSTRAMNFTSDPANKLNVINSLGQKYT